MRAFAFLQTAKEWGIFFGVLVCVFVLGVGWRYYQYTQIPSTPYELKAKVLAQYEKNDKIVLKLKAQNGQIFYTSSKEKLRDLSHREILAYGKVFKCDFLQSLKSCYFISYSISLLPTSIANLPYKWIMQQHQNPLIGKLFESLFFASFLPKEWREIASALHISHLFAISGLHLGILAWVLYFVLGGVYGLFHQRFFPYRNKIFDMGFLVSVLLLGYMIFIDAPPAFLRAYVMSLIALLFVCSHLRLMSFSFLAVCGLCILALFPALFVNIGFWLSILGVFYIFLFFHYFSFQNSRFKWIVSAVLLNTFLFFEMLPIIHYFFGDVSVYAIFSIPLSIVFPLWFVAVALMHCVGLGGLLDGILQRILGANFESFEIYTPLWFLLLHLIFSLCAMRFKIAYFLTLGMGCGFWLFLMIKMFR